MKNLYDDYLCWKVNRIIKNLKKIQAYNEKKYLSNNIRKIDIKVITCKGKSSKTDKYEILEDRVILRSSDADENLITKIIYKTKINETDKFIEDIYSIARKGTKSANKYEDSEEIYKCGTCEISYIYLSKDPFIHSETFNIWLQNKCGETVYEIANEFFEKNLTCENIISKDIYEK